MNIRQSYEYKKWKEDVLFRDGYKCVVCGSNYELEVHHIKPLAQFPELATHIENGITLCKKCHYEAHNKSYSQDIMNNISSVQNALHPFFTTLRDITYYMVLRIGIVKKFWKELPLPRKMKRWLENIFWSLMLLLFLAIVSKINEVFS